MDTVNTKETVENIIWKAHVKWDHLAKVQKIA